ncbi:hypothetical protein psyc5s11_10700 [Clostridium gelidum]|uniref:Cadherin-like beta-sandwich-like domain-containing protein n=1 Tax=Clostridium gelidum TaxID=704125 RepID=A0ABM7SZV5_9CLOT|nr:cadherin-like beta sandwich domain-containing protein [Clostridium gelidum]BCZ45003.1 hypothetical protein psyc5s11_10700 [Clostridium gelidum]
MNKKDIKKIISIALAFSLTPTIMPSVLNLGTTAVYAASSSGYVTDIKLETNKDDTVKVYTKSSYNSRYKLSEISDKAPTSLYAKVRSNVRKIKITDIDLGTNCDKVEIYKGSTKINLDEEISISSSVTLKIQAYSGSTLKETYNLKIKKENSSSNSSDDDIYLDDLSLTYDSDDIDFNFDKEKSSYDIDVKNKVSYVKICAEPEDKDYTVKINGSTVDDGDDWTDKVSLSEGKNTVTVKIKDDDNNQREYNLNIKRLSSNESNATSSTSSLSTSLSEGWHQTSGEWYFITPDGAKQTGWQKIDGRWYYMNESGLMQTGWIKSGTNGKSYYLNPISNGFKGAMVVNAIGEGYRIGSDGAKINN